ncbi:Rad17 cell cycle checkpoint protein-domain-containing protein [Mycena rebaudengoi]|nr:Rad17 cell cycle checkpoint protein-domain-containing protein [Mycena rebaudengoi]
MAPKRSQPSSSSAKSQKKTKASTSKLNTVKFDAPPPTARRINPLTAFANTQIIDVDARTASQPTKKSKGKEKERVADPPDDRLWVDIYEPATEAELAVHVKKVQDVRRWLDEAFVGGPSGKLRKYRRILALTGPAGVAKTATIRVLARELDCEILEWRNGMGDAGMSSGFGGDSPPSSSSYSRPYNADHEAHFSKFETFLARASSCQNVFATSDTASQSLSARKRYIILLEDLPNILHANTQSQFHAALQSLVASPTLNPVPIVIIVSDAGMRGEASDERLAAGSWGKDRDVLDIRTVFFNPIALTLMKKALQALLATHFAKSGGTAPSKEFLDTIIESSNGDIRSAIMALQFSCIVDIAGGKSRKKGNANNSAKAVLEAVTRREQSLALFHLIARVLYNKRKGDPPNPSAKAKDILKDKTLDATLRDPPPMPDFLAGHARRTSRVDVDALYADSPIDSSLFSLYIHQNYTQFCNETEECEGVADWLSWVDSSGGEAWYQANPHRFHLLTLGTLHSLPTPVTRRSQKIFKPEFFDFLNREKDAWEAVRDDGAGYRLGGWSRAEVVTELGGVLKARDAKWLHGSQPSQSQSQSQSPSQCAPSSHRRFSHLQFFPGGGSGNELGEGEAASEGVEVPEDEGGPRGGWGSGGWGGDDVEGDGGAGGGWLEGDDIEDF